MMYGNGFNTWNGASPWGAMLGGWISAVGFLLFPLVIWVIFWKVRRLLHYDLRRRDDDRRSNDYVPSVAILLVVTSV